MAKLNLNNLMHLIRYGTAGDQKYLLGDFLKTYDAVIVNANILVHTPAAISSFLFERTLNKPFIIDPQTYAFALDLKFITSNSKGKSKGSIKKPYIKLAEIYGDLFADKLSKKIPIQPNEISKSLKSIVKNVCDFQLTYLQKQMKDDDVEKYYDFVEEEGGLSLKNSPEFLIPPYFYLDVDANFQEWLSLNIKSAVEAIKQFPNNKIVPQIVFSKEVLYNAELLGELVSSYLSIQGITHLQFWIDDHNENQLTQKELSTYLNFLNLLGKDKKLINLYGGAFSIIASRTKTATNLKGVCHSIEYGEVRPVSPVGGGIPVSKFYLPIAFFRYKYRDVITILTDKGWLKTPELYYKNVCDCKICQSIILDKPDKNFEYFGKMNTKKTKGKDGVEVSKQYPTGESKDLCKQHYMYCKHTEYTDANFIDIKKTLQKLKADSIKLSEAPHLKQWISALEKSNKE